MTRRLVVRRQARLELAEATDWYDARDVRLGDELLYTYDRAIQAIMENPYQYQRLIGSYRRVPLGKFPYGLLYTVSETEIVIVSCFHGRRDPRRWQELP
jgi:plasmid stabilization system protein ParE